MDRVIRDGRVAVLYSPGYGAGWYTSHYIEALIFDPSIVLWLENDEYDKIKHYVTLKYPDAYLGGLDDLTVKWLQEGTLFKIDEYDGNESVSVREEEQWFIA